MDKHLKDISYYENIYDNLMIEECSRLSKIAKKSWNNKEYEKLNMEAVEEMLIMLEKHKWYKNRDKTILDRINRDREIDNFIENSKPFEWKYCRLCNSSLEYESKIFMSWSWKVANRMLYLYKCNNCNKRQWIYSDWEEVVSKPHTCNKCWEIVEYKANMDWDLLIENFKCNECWYKENKETNYSIKETIKDNISDKDRLKYWYNKKESSQIIWWFENIERLSDIIDSQKEKEAKKDLYEKVNKLNKLNIVSLKKLIEEKIKETKFTDFKIISNQEARKWIEISFTIFYDWNFWDDSSKELIKLIDSILSNTNWDVIKSSIHDKLWILNWKLIWYDNNEMLIELIQKRK